MRVGSGLDREACDFLDRSRTPLQPQAKSTSQVLDAAALKSAQEHNEQTGGQTLVVLHDGKTLLESYAHGGAAGRMQMLASGSKSFLGVLAMAAVQDGMIRLDDRACEAIAEWADDPVRSAITYRQLLTLTSGITPGEVGVAARTPAWKDLITKPMTGRPGAS